MRCPGQDMRYWKPEDIFNVTCSKCGKDVEFFKDDVVLRCPHCKTANYNPRIEKGCAAWCKHAAECLGEMKEE